MKKTIPYIQDLSLIQALDISLFPAILQSTQPVSGAHWDILFALPQGALCLDSDGKIISQDSKFDINGDDQFLTNFDYWYQYQKQQMLNNESLPFIGGWFLFLSYEINAEIEPKLLMPDSGENFPRALAIRFPAAIMTNHDSKQSYIFIEDNYKELYKDLAYYVNCYFETKINKSQLISHIKLNSLNEDNPDEFIASVEKILEYIVAGDVFQVNLSREWIGKKNDENSYLDIYRALKIANPAPFSGLLIWDGKAIVSSSPERLVQVNNNRISTRPIAGTRPRGATAELDKKLHQELLLNLKERSEHIMLIDLERNDIGKVCKPGSVLVDEFMILESYQYVHHIVSNVTGELIQGIKPVDIIKAVFPGGTITGCPKFRCMEIITELEKKQRGAYTGSFGYISLNGDMDLNILIRTLLVDHNEIRFRAGCGIVADSNPLHELAETRAKAKGLIKAFTG